MHMGWAQMRKDERTCKIRAAHMDDADHLRGG